MESVSLLVAEPCFIVTNGPAQACSTTLWLALLHSFFLEYLSVATVMPGLVCINQIQSCLWAFSILTLLSGSLKAKSSSSQSTKRVTYVLPSSLLCLTYICVIHAHLSFFFPRKGRKDAERGRNSVPQGKAHQLVTQYQMVSPEDIHTGNLYTGIYRLSRLYS